MKINLDTCEWANCECEGKTFEQKVMFKRISPIMSPHGKEEFVPIEVYICTSCNAIPSFISDKIPGIPTELQASPKFSID